MISYYGALAHGLPPAGSHQDVSCGPGLVRNAVNSSSQLGLCGKYYGSALQRICILLEPHSHFASCSLHVGLAPSEDNLCHNWTSTRSRAHKRKKRNTIEHCVHSSAPNFSSMRQDDLQCQSTPLVRQLASNAKPTDSMLHRNTSQIASALCSYVQLLPFADDAINR